MGQDRNERELAPDPRARPTGRARRRVVETVVGRGYRFVAEIQHVYADDPGLPWAPASPAQHGAARRVVGRESELDTLRAAHRAARDRKRGVIFVTGEAGSARRPSWIPSSSARASMAGPRWPWHLRRAARQRASLSTGPRRDRHVVPWCGLARHRHLCRARADMAGADAGARARGSAGRGAAPRQRYSQGRSLREGAKALDTLSADEPLVLVFEDLQWTDPSTAEFLAFMGSRREPARVLVLGTYRPAEVPRRRILSRVTGRAHRAIGRLRRSR